MTVISFAERAAAKAVTIKSADCLVSAQAASPVEASYQGRSAQDWTNQEIADFYHAQHVLRQQGVGVGIDRGISDIGEPWLVLFGEELQDVYVHIARIDGECILVSDALSLKLEAATVGDLVVMFETAIRGLVQDRASSQSNVVMHPSARIVLSLAVLILLLKFDVIDKAEAGETADQDEALMAELTSPEFGREADGLEDDQLRESTAATSTSELDAARKADILGRAQSFLARTGDQYAADASTSIASTAIATAAHLMLIAALSDLEAAEKVRDRSTGDDAQVTGETTTVNSDVITKDAQSRTSATSVDDVMPDEFGGDDVIELVGGGAVADALFRPAEMSQAGLTQVDAAQQMALHVADFEPVIRGGVQQSGYFGPSGTSADASATNAGTETASVADDRTEEADVVDEVATTTSSDHDDTEAANQALVQASSASAYAAAETTKDLDSAGERAIVTIVSSSNIPGPAVAITNFLPTSNSSIDSSGPSSVLDQSFGASLATQLVKNFEKIEFAVSQDTLNPISDSVDLLVDEGVVYPADNPLADPVVPVVPVVDDAGGGIAENKHAGPNLVITIAELGSILAVAGSVRTTEVSSGGIIGVTLANTFQAFGENAEVKIDDGDVLIEQEGADNLDPASLGVWINTMADDSQIIIVGQAAVVDGLQVAIG